MDQERQILHLRRDLIKPLPSQEKYLNAIHLFEYVFFGGAAGPGKSYVLRWGMVELLVDWFQMYGLKDVRVGLFCEDYPTLKDRQITRIEREFPSWLGGLRDSKTEGMAYHIRPEYGGGVIALRNLDDPAKYASSEFAAIGVDEITKNDRQTFDDLRFRKRWPGIEHSPFMAASNPGSKGHGWVKKLWIDRDFTGDDSNLNPDSFIFIPARAGENPNLPKSYWDTLNSLPPKMRQAMLEGNWSIFKGQIFTEFDQSIHVSSEFDYPLNQCQRFITYDWGYGKPGCALWIAVSPINKLGIRRAWVYREIYQAGKDPKEWAEEIQLYNKLDKAEFMTLPHDCFSTTRGEQTIAETFKSIIKTYIIAAPSLRKGSRIGGLALMHQWLNLQSDGRPGLYIHPRCVNLIRTLPDLVYSENEVEYWDDKSEDHAEDALRIGLLTLRLKSGISGPVTPRPKAKVSTVPTLAMDSDGNYLAPDFLEAQKQAMDQRKISQPEFKK